MSVKVAMLEPFQSDRGGRSPSYDANQGGFSQRCTETRPRPPPETPTVCTLSGVYLLAGLEDHYGDGAPIALEDRKIEPRRA